MKKLGLLKERLNKIKFMYKYKIILSCKKPLVYLWLNTLVQQIVDFLKDYKFSKKSRFPLGEAEQNRFYT